MSAKILQGEEIAKRVLEDSRNKVQTGVKLAVIQVGENKVSETYIRTKEEVAQVLGIEFELFQFADDISGQQLKVQVDAIGKDESVSGMIVQLPLPKHIDRQEILDCIPLQKDVDVLSSHGFGLFALGKLPIMPPTVGAVSLLFQEHRIALKGKPVLIVGAGRLVGLPLAIWCIQQGATVTVANEHTKDLAAFAKKAAILISGVGKAGLIKANMISKGVVIVDAGTSVEEGRSVGDVDFKGVSKKAGFLTPVPGGVGPLTVACLLRNLIALQKL